MMIAWTPEMQLADLRRALFSGTAVRCSRWGRCAGADLVVGGGVLRNVVALFRQPAPSFGVVWSETRQLHAMCCRLAYHVARRVEGAGV